MRLWISLSLNLVLSPALNPSLGTALLGQSSAPTTSTVEARIKKDLFYLASPELKGRGNGSPELDLAAKRLEANLKSLGLKPEIQTFPFVARITREEAQISVMKGDMDTPLEWGKDVEAYGFSADARFRMRPLAFVGYGVSTKDYDDLGGIELRRRTAIISRTVPNMAPFANLSAGDRSLWTRLKRLEQAEVAAVIVVEEEGPVRPLRREAGPSKLNIPVLSMKVDALKSACGDLKERLKKIRETGKPNSQDYIYAPWSILTLTLKLKREEVPLPNVICIIPGSDPKLKKEYIAIGAHMDHLGLGERSSLGGDSAKGQVHAGADDNASGTVLVMELARQLKKAKSKRSILVMHFSGEEEGLLGSKHWVQNPTVPLESVKFMLNFDMVGRLNAKESKLIIGNHGSPKSALERAKELAPKHFTLTSEIGPQVGGSDHMSFAQAKIPTFFFFTGLHGDYHRPSDLPEKIDIKGLSMLTSYAKDVALDLANTPNPPAFDPETAKIHSRGDAGPMNIRFGTIPDYTEHPKGFRINGVTTGSTAEALGLKEGDIITHFGTMVIRNIYDYMGALNLHKPGDKAIIKWLRGDKAMEAEATLRGRN